MFYNDRKDILEFHDLDGMHELELVNENGRQFVRVLFSIRPDRPPFEGDEQPHLLLLTNGSATRMFAVTPKPEPVVGAPEEVPVLPANEYLSTENSAESAAAATPASKRASKAVADSVSMDDAAVATELPVTDVAPEVAPDSAEESTDGDPKAE